MKKLLLVFLLILITTITFSQSPIGKGSRLTYKLSGAKTGSFTVTISGLKPTTLVISGDVTNTMAFAETANKTAIKVFITDLKTIPANDALTLWLSDASANELKDNNYSTLTIDNQPTRTFLYTYTDTYKVGTTKFPVLYIEEESGLPYKLWVLDDGTNHLVLKAVVDKTTVELIAIN